MLPALLIFLTYMLTYYLFAYLLLLLSEAYHYTEFVLLLSKTQYLKNSYVKYHKVNSDVRLECKWLRCIVSEFEYIYVSVCSHHYPLHSSAFSIPRLLHTW